VVGKWIGLCNEELRDLYQSPALVGMIKSVEKRRMEHVVISYVQIGRGRRAQILYNFTLKS
jgi:hypothetical protein